MKRGIVLAMFGALAAVVAGCTPQGTWGNHAIYAPDLREYVLEASPGSRSVMALVNPITGKKIRCREDLDRYLPAITRSLATGVHDLNMVPAVGIPAILVTAPLAVPGGVLIYAGGVIGAGPAELFYRALESPAPDALYEKGTQAFEQHRDAEAELLFERALLKSLEPASGGTGPDVMRAGYFLGILYERAGRPRDAGRAFKMFVERAQVRDEAAYRQAEERLVSLDPAALPACRSRAPVTFAWPPPGAASPGQSR